jgi:SRSO17 transposase
VSVHAVGSGGTVPLGWALYLPREWCDDPERRRKAKIPEQVRFKTKLELGVGLVERAAGWGIATAPVLGDQAYGESIQLRDGLDRADCQYVLAVGPDTSVFAPETTFATPARKPRQGGPRRRPKPDRDPEQVQALCQRLGVASAQTVSFRDGPDGEQVSSRFLFARVRIGRPFNTRTREWRTGKPIPREEWLIAEWPEGHEHPSGYWLSNLPAGTEPQRLARLARLRWKIELDYKQLKGELGLDHYEGRSWLGWHHHTALVTAAHGFLTLERLDRMEPPLVRWRPVDCGEWSAPAHLRGLPGWAR